MNLNFLSLFLSALVPMALGFVWYHPKVMGTAWQQQTGLTDEKLKSGNMAMIFGISLICSLMLAFVMNLIAYHDNFVGGALFYLTKGMPPEAGTDAAKWMDYYTNNLAASNHTFKHGAFHGLMIGGVFMALPIMVTNALFERKTLKYAFINAGYWILCLAIMGGITAAMR